MASASLHTASPARKRRPSPDLILRTYRQECSSAGDRGAANRAAALLGISDDTVRRVVARDEAARKAREQTPQELVFTPPDAAYEAQRDIINRKLAAELAARLPPDVRQTYVKAERESGESAATTPHDDTADRRTGERGNTPRAGLSDAAPGHARPDVDVPGAETPELPPEVFPNPEPNQPPHPSPEHDQAVPDWPSTGDESPTPKPKAQHPRPVPVPPGPPEPEPVPTPDPSPVPTPPLVQRVVVRVPEPAPLGGLVGWLATGPMLGPVPVWALLLLAFGALLVQLGLLG